jgi:hypothetical protein
VNLYEYLFPCDIFPDDVNLPSSLVTVCGAESILVHATVVPTFTVSGVGEYLKPVMSMVLSIPPLLPGGFGFVTESLLEHEANTNNVRTNNKNAKKLILDNFINKLLLLGLY